MWNSFEVVYLMRHGQTEWNSEGRRQGQLDSPLTARGQAQAEAVAAELTALPIDAIFSSPLGRARATADVAADRIGLTCRTLDALAEVHHGDMAGLTDPEIEARYPGALVQRRADLYEWAFPGGESYADVDRRAHSALAAVAEAGARRPLLVSHEMIGRMLLRNLLGMQPPEALSTSQPNYVVYAVDPRSLSYSRIAAEQR